jgi:hypothetical protein
VVEIMFWQVVLFILIALAVITLRVFSQATEDEGLDFLSFLLSIGVMFFVPFAIKWSLNFLLDYSGLSYWTIMGLYVLRNVIFNKVRKVEN